MNNFISSSTIQAIKDAMVPIAQKIGSGAEYGWMVLIKQQYVVAVGDAVAAVAALIVFVTVYRLAKYFFHQQIEVNKVDRYNQGGYAVLCGFAVAAAVAMFVLFFVALYGAAAHFINPDFYAIKFLIDTVHPATTQ